MSHAVSQQRACYMKEKKSETDDKHEINSNTQYGRNEHIDDGGAMMFELKSCSSCRKSYKCNMNESTIHIMCTTYVTAVCNDKPVCRGICLRIICNTVM